MKLLSVIFLLLAPFLAIAASPAQRTDCSKVLSTGLLPSGVETIYPPGSSSSVQVFCEPNGYTVILKRTNQLVTFNSNLMQYTTFFGNAAAEYFIGLENLNLLTKSQTYELLVLLEDVNGATMTFRYNSFSVGSAADTYPVTISGFTGAAGENILDGNRIFSSIKRGPNRDWFYFTNAQGTQYVGVEKPPSVQLNLQLNRFIMMIRPN